VIGPPASEAALPRAVALGQPLSLPQSRRTALGQCPRVSLDLGDPTLGRRKDRLDLGLVSGGCPQRPDRPHLGLERGHGDLERHPLDLVGVGPALAVEELVRGGLDLRLRGEADPVGLAQELDLALRLGHARRVFLPGLVLAATGDEDGRQQDG